MIKKLLAIFFAIALCITPAYALSIPKQDTSIYVNDYANVLSESSKTQLISINKKSDNETGGYVVVATFDFVDEDLYDFSYRLFNKWEIGHEDYNNGILLVLDIGNDNYCYMLGSGIERILTDSEARYIIDTYMEPYFAKQDYDNAVLETTKQFLKVIDEEDRFIINDGSTSNDDNYRPSTNLMTIGGILAIMPFIIFFLFVIFVILSSNRRRYRRYTTYVPPRPLFWYSRPHYHHHTHVGPGPFGLGARPRPERRPTGFNSHFSRPNTFGGTRPSSGFRPSGGASFGGGRHHSGGGSRGAGGTRH